MLEKILREEIREAEQLFHGDIIKERASEYGFSKEQFIDFSTNVNALGPPKSVLESLKKNLCKISDYPPHEPEEVRRHLAEYANVPEEKIVLGNGSNQLIHLLARIFLERGDEALIVEPTFTEYSKAAKMQGSDISTVQLKESDGFSLDIEEFQEKMTQKTKLVFICSPNNPTGKTIPLQTLKETSEICKEFESYALIDEVFHEYCEDSQEHNTEEIELENLLFLRSFTKFYAVPGLRIGYLIAPEYLAKVIRNVKTRWSVNVLAQTAIKEIVKDSEFVSKTKKMTRKWKKFLARNLKKFTGLNTYPTDANFFLINIKKSGLNSTQMVEELLQKGIAVRECRDFKYLDENYIRINIRPINDCKKLIESLEEINSSGVLEE